MLILVAIPKEFKGHVGIIQENALRSWLQLMPQSSILLFGRDPSLSQMEKKYGVRTISDTPCNEYGTPYLNHIFKIAASQDQGTKFVVYVNADCILDRHFIHAMHDLVRLGCNLEKFLLSAQRVNIDIDELIDFTVPNIDSMLIAKISQGVSDSKSAMDVFVFPPEMVENFPPFLVGRPCWDQWFIWHARNINASVIDASDTFKVIHQSHDYRHVTGGWREACLGTEASYNRSLAAGNQSDLSKARTHTLSGGRLAPLLPDGVVSDEIVEERICYYALLAGKNIDREEYETALDYLDILLVLGKDAIPHVQQMRAICFIKLNRLLEAKSAIIQELHTGSASREALAIFSFIAKKMGKAEQIK